MRCAAPARSRAPLAGLRALVEQKRAGAYRGEISVNCVIGDAMVGRLLRPRALLRDGRRRDGLSQLPVVHLRRDGGDDGRLLRGAVSRARGSRASRAGTPTTSRLDPARLDELRADLARVDAASWRLKLRYNPALEADELARVPRRERSAGAEQDALPGAADAARRVSERRRRLVQVLSRILRRQPARSCGRPTYGTASATIACRETVARCGLMPVCAKCNLLYTRGA